MATRYATTALPSSTTPLLVRVLAAGLVAAAIFAPAEARAGFCTGLGNGWWCDGNDLVYCYGGTVSSRDN